MFSAFIRYCKRNENAMRQYMSYSYTSRKPDSVRREVLYNILIEFQVHMKVVRLIKMCLNETYSKVHISKHFSDNIPIQNGLKQGDALSPLLFNFALEYSIRKVREKPGRTEIERDTSVSGS
jgi:hypothetical protein